MRGTPHINWNTTGQIQALVDYDNVEPNLSKHGPLFLAQWLTDKLLDHSAPTKLPRRLELRIYGGWYENSAFTHRAQSISTAIQRDFPSVRNVPNSTHRVILHADLAYSTLAEPRFHLRNTFRARGFPSGIKVRHPSAIGCSTTPCDAQSIALLIAQGRCGTATCSISLEQILYRAEQKLVDIMIASDLLFLATTNPDRPIVLVSSDHDFIPAVRQAASHLRAHIVHVHGRHSYSTPQFYTTGLGSHYTEICHR